MFPTDESQLRDWFAGMVLASPKTVGEIVTRAETMVKQRQAGLSDALDRMALDHAKCAYIIADAALKARKLDPATLRTPDEATTLACLARKQFQ